MRRQVLTVGGWLGAVCLVASVVWSCSGSDTNPFGSGQRNQGGSGATSGTGGTSGATGGGTGGTNGGTDSGSSGSGGTSGASTGGSGTPTGGMATGGSATDGGEGGDGTTTGGSAGTAGTGGGGMAGNAGTPAMGGAGTSGSPTGGAGASAGAGMGGGGSGMAGGMSGSGGTPGVCREDNDCADTEYCKKASCDAETGQCMHVGPECFQDDAEFDPVCGCDGITYWNTCVIVSNGINVAMAGECTGSGRPTCTRTAGGDACPPRTHSHCYRPVEMCGDPSPMNGVCWVLPEECPANEPQTERYCGGTAGEARCIGLCEVIDAENSFRRNSNLCD